MARGVQIAFDANDPHALAAWWAELLGYEVEADDGFVRGLLEQGTVTADEVVEVDGVLCFAAAASMTDPTGGGPRFFFQRVPEHKSGKNRLHLDVRVGQDNIDTEVERLTATGATFVRFGEHPGERWAVMQDPEGNEFCLT